MNTTLTSLGIICIAIATFWFIIQTDNRLKKIEMILKVKEWTE